MTVWRPVDAVAAVLRAEFAATAAGSPQHAQLTQIADALSQAARTTVLPAPATVDVALIEAATGYGGSAAPTVPTDRLRTLLARHRADGSSPEALEVRRLSGGFSKELLAVTVQQPGGAHRLCLRIVAPGRDRHGLRSEFAIVQHAWRNGIPVPEPLWYDEDVLGRPVAALAAVGGQAPGNVWQWTRPASAPIALALAQVLGALHALGTHELPTPPVAALFTREDHLTAVKERAAVVAACCDGTWAAEFEAALAWLRAHVPSGGSARVLTHGDFGLHNCLVEQERLQAVLDWERAHLGSAAEDLAYVREAAVAATDWRRFLAAYHAAGGPAVDPAELTYFAVWQDVWRAVSSYRLRAKFLAEPTRLTDAVAGLLLAPTFLGRALHTIEGADR